MSKRTGFRSVCIRPREDFGSFSDAVQLAGADGSIDLSPRLFDVPALAVLVDKQGMPMWLPTLYLVDCALRGRSVTGDTVRSYAEALITWFTFLDELGFCQEEVTEDVFALFRTDVAHSPSSSTGRVRSSATANHRVAVVCGFHLWGEKRGLLHTPLGCFLLKREEEHRGQSRLNMPYRDLSPHEKRRLEKGQGQAAELVASLDRGDITPEDLDAETKQKLLQLLGGGK